VYIKGGELEAFDHQSCPLRDQKRKGMDNQERKRGKVIFLEFTGGNPLVVYWEKKRRGSEGGKGRQKKKVPPPPPPPKRGDLEGKWAGGREGCPSRGKENN